MSHFARPIVLDDSTSLIRARQVHVGDILIIGKQEWECEVTEIDFYMRGGHSWYNFHFDNPGIDLAARGDSLVIVKHQTLL